MIKIISIVSIISTVKKLSNDSIVWTVLRPFSKGLKIMRPVLIIESIQYVLKYLQITYTWTYIIFFAISSNDLFFLLHSALLRLIVLSLSQLHGPLDRLIHAILSSDKLHPDRLQDDLTELIESTDSHADRLFHIAHFAMYCTNDASTAQSLTNSLHLAQILEKELVPACLKLYFSHDDIGAKIQLRNLRSLWRTEIESIEAKILDIVDPTAFCIIVEAEARRIASAVKKDQYSQDRDWIRISVSQVVRLCQMAVDFAWKEMSSSSSETNRLPDDHPIIRVERSTWEVQAALKMVIANVEDLHVHKV